MLDAWEVKVQGQLQTSVLRLQIFFGQGQMQNTADAHWSIVSLNSYNPLLIVITDAIAENCKQPSA